MVNINWASCNNMICVSDMTSMTVFRSFHLDADSSEFLISETDELCWRSDGGNFKHLQCLKFTNTDKGVIYL